MSANGLTQSPGLDKMQKSTNAYIKGISKRCEIEGKEKILPVAHMGATMISHGEDFEQDSEMGQCLNCKIPLPSLSHFNPDTLLQ
jgi:hypothetical protein